MNILKGAIAPFFIGVILCSAALKIHALKNLWRLYTYTKLPRNSGMHDNPFWFMRMDIDQHQFATMLVWLYSG